MKTQPVKHFPDMRAPGLGGKICIEVTKHPLPITGHCLRQLERTMSWVLPAAALNLNESPGELDQIINELKEIIWNFGGEDGDLLSLGHFAPSRNGVVEQYVSFQGMVQLSKNCNFLLGSHGQHQKPLISVKFSSERGSILKYLRRNVHSFKAVYSYGIPCSVSQNPFWCQRELGYIYLQISWVSHLNAFMNLALAAFVSVLAGLWTRRTHCPQHYKYLLAMLLSCSVRSSMERMLTMPCA